MKVLCIAEHPATDNKCIHRVYRDKCSRKNSKEAKEIQCSGYWNQEDQLRERDEVIFSQIQLNSVNGKIIG